MVWRVWFTRGFRRQEKGFKKAVGAEGKLIGVVAGGRGRNWKTKRGREGMRGEFRQAM